MQKFRNYLETQGYQVQESGRIDRCPVCDAEESASLLGETIRCFRPTCKLGALDRNLSLPEFITMVDPSNNTGIIESIDIDGITIEGDDGNQNVDINLIDKILSEAIKFFHSELLEAPDRLNYLFSRKRTSESIAEFQVGLIRNSTKLNNRLHNLYSDDQLETVGLFDFSNNTYPRLKLNHNAYCYPVYVDGKIRNIKTKGIQCCYLGKKYIGTNYARFFNYSALQNETIIIVEGENDAMRLWEMGYKNVVATFGNLGAKQIEHIKGAKKIKNIFLCFDNDDAGRKYTVRFIKALSRVSSKVVKIIPYEGKDPDVGENFDWKGITPEEFLKTMPDEIQAVVHENNKDFQELDASYAKVLVQGNVQYIPKKTPLTNWMQSKSLREYESRRNSDNVKHWIKNARTYENVMVDFQNPGQSGASFNLFKGLAVAPKNTGVDISLIYCHIRDVLCSGDDKIYLYLMDWIAHMFQRPSEVAGTAPVFISQQGAGKGILVDQLLGAIIGSDYFVSTGNGDNLTNQFNSIIEGKLLVNVDEASFSGNHQEAGIFKKYIGNATVLIVRKGLEAYSTQNRMRMIVTSQHDTAVKVEQSNRRWFVPNVSDKYVYARQTELSETQIKEYFNTLTAIIENGGREQFLYDMLQRDISKFNRFKGPVTANEKMMKEFDVDDVETWFRSSVLGLLPQDMDWTQNIEVKAHGFLLSSIVFELYKKYNPTDRFMKPTILSMRLSKLMGVQSTIVMKINKIAVRGWRVDVQSMKQKFENELDSLESAEMLPPNRLALDEALACESDLNIGGEYMGKVQKSFADFEIKVDALRQVLAESKSA